MVVPENLDGKSFLLCPRRLHGLMEDENLKRSLKSIILNLYWNKKKSVAESVYKTYFKTLS